MTGDSKPPRPSAPPPGEPRFHGRRHGRRLRPGRRALLKTLLPTLRVPPAPTPVDPRSLFTPSVTAVWLEIGFGAGEHLAAQAAAHPDVGFIGCEPFVNGVAALLSRVREGDLRNVRVHDDDARLLLPRLADASIGLIDVLFPDPWPKARHAGRRIIGPDTIPELTRILADDGLLTVASDHPQMVRWSLAHLTATPSLTWTARRAVDWRTPPDGHVETRYQAKTRASGQAATFLRFRRNSR